MEFFNSAVKKAFDAYKKENGSDKKLPRISELNAEFAMLLERKKSSYLLSIISELSTIAKKI